MARRRIVALTDSVGMPRIVDGDDTYYEHTWPAQLQERLRDAADVIACGSRGRTANTLVRHQFREHVEMKRPTDLVLQCGVVDCAPRVFRRRTKRLLGSPLVPAFVRRPIVRAGSRYRHEIIGDRPLRRVYTDPPAFRRFMTMFRDRLASHVPRCRPITLAILAHPCMDEKSPGFSENVALYNEILRDVWGDAFVPVAAVFDHGVTRELFSTDGFHLSVSGHAAVTDSLVRRLRA